MNSPEEFADLVSRHIGIPITRADLELSFDELPGWDSIHLMWLLNVLERTTGRIVPLPDMLEASSLARVYDLVVSA